MQITLYTTQGCHLCDEAEHILAQVQPSIASLSIQYQEIGDDDELVARYGIRIPVIAKEDGEELGWPFDQIIVENFINE